MTWNDYTSPCQLVSDGQQLVKMSAKVSFRGSSGLDLAGAGSPDPFLDVSLCFTASVGPIE